LSILSNVGLLTHIWTILNAAMGTHHSCDRFQHEPFHSHVESITQILGEVQDMKIKMHGMEDM